VKVGDEFLTGINPRHARRAGIARVPQELTIVGDHSIAENVMLGLLPSSGGFVRRSEMLASARAQLARVGLGADIDPRDEAHALTPVQQRLVMIAQALTNEPRVLVLDEPSAALPAETAAVLKTITTSLAGEGVAIVYVSHRLNEIRDLCDRVVAMRDGAVVGELVGEQIDVDEMVRLIGGGDLTEHPADASHAAAVTERPVIVRARELSGRRVSDVDLDVHEGEVLGVGGLYGAGRSELLRLIVGSQRPEAGTIELLDAPGPRSAQEAARRGVGYVAEGRARMIFRGMSTRTNTSISSLSRFSFAKTFIRGSQERRAVDEVTSRVRLVGDPSAEISTLSGGNQQKVFLARWLLLQSRVLLLDEPTVGVDVHARAEIHGLLLELARKGTTIIVASAEPEELATLCDRVVVLVEGRLERELRKPFAVDTIVAASYRGRA
jgi:ribose transport system ATP-binding protein